MPVFSAAAAVIVAAVAPALAAGTTGFLIAQSVVAAGLALGVGHAPGAFDTPDVDFGPEVTFDDPGVEQRLAANTQNKLPCLYGNWMQRGALTFFELSDDRQTLYAVVSLGEVTGNMTIDRVIWNDVTLTIGSDGEITAGALPDGEVDNRTVGSLNVQLYPNGGRSTYLEGLSPDWNENHRMTGIAYAVVTVRYNRDKDVTTLADMRFVGTSSTNDPADVVIDQLTNTNYGLGLDSSFIDFASFSTARTYFQTLVASEDSNGATVMLPRFQANGTLGTDQNVRDRIESVLAGCNASLRWDGGQYSLFVNRQEPAVAFTFSQDNILGDITVVERGMNSLINRLQLRYGRDEANNWQRNEVTIETPAADRFPNEIDRFRSIELPMVATQVEAERAGFIILNESREQLTIRHRANVEAMPVEAGDVLNYTHPEFGWVNKLFRITRVTEVEEAGEIQYDIEAIEYADAVYAERMHIEPGAAPNTNLPTAAFIPAVDNLMVVNVEEDAVIPSFGLQWTIPSVGIIEVYDIHVNSSGGQFTDNSTVFLQSVRPAAGTPHFVNGAGFATTISALPAGTYNIWVVGRNDFVTSDPSNTVNLVWEPAVDVNTVEVIRHHENDVANDPGPPMGPEGTGGGWYDPVEGSSITTNRPADPDPHWEARTTAPVPDASNRVVDFLLSGVSGNTIQTITNVEQMIEFTFSGMIGERMQTQTATQERTQFTFSGTSSVFTGGGRETWNVAAVGISEETDNEAAAIAYELDLFGSSGFSAFPYVRTVDIEDAVTDVTSNIPVTTAYNVGDTITVTTSGLDNDVSFSYTITQDDVDNIADGLVGNQLRFSNYRSRMFVIIEDGLVAASGLADGVDALTALRSRSEGTFAIYHPTATLSVEYDGAVSTTTARLLPEGTGTGQRFRDFQNYRAPTATLASVRVQSTQDNLDVTFNVPRGLDTNTVIGNASTNRQNFSQTRPANGLRDNLISQMQASSELTAVFNVTESGTNFREIDLIPVDGAPRDLNITFSGGDRSMATTDGSLSNLGFEDSQVHTETRPVSTIVQVAFDQALSLAPVQVDLGGRNSSTIAELIATTLNGVDGISTGYTSGNTFTITPDINGNFAQPVFTIVRPGTGSPTTTFTVTTTTAGSTTAGSPTGYSVVLNGAQVAGGSFASGIDSDAAAAVVQGAIDALDTHTATVSSSVVVATSVASQDEDLVVNINTGTTSAGTPTPNDIGVATQVLQEGNNVNEFIGSDTVIEPFVGTDSLGPLNLRGFSLAQALTAVASAFTTDGRFTGTVDTDTNMVNLVSTFTGPSPTATITINDRGSLPDGSATGFAIIRNVVNDGTVATVTAGQLTIVTVRSNGLINNITLTGNSDAESAAAQVEQGLVDLGSQYRFARTGATIRATSDFTGPTPDITVEITTQGQSTDAMQSTLAVQRDVIDIGRAGTPDLTAASWDYYIINQEVRVDDDTVMMMPDNALAVRRGIIEDADTLQGFSGFNEVLAPAQFGHQVVTGNLATQFVISGILYAAFTQQTGTTANEISVSGALEVSTDGGTNWVSIGNTLSFQVVGPAVASAHNNSSIIAPIPISLTTMATPNTTYDVRIRLRFTRGGVDLPSTPTNIDYTDFAWSVLFLEELATTYTDTGEDVATVVSNSQFTVSAPTSLAMGQRIANNGQGNNHVTISSVSVSGNTATVTHGIRGANSPFTAGDSIFRQ